MCGFAGWVTTETAAPADEAVLRRAGRYLAPRGPDEEVALRRPGFQIVFRRLAIVDVAGGRQPFESADGRHIVAVNGEIYNHLELASAYLPDTRFASRSDCEVVLHLYRRLGPEFLTQLNGIYAIAIWDCAERRLLLARDRLGVKPLYQAAIGDKLMFASELKALLAHPEAPREIDWPAFGHVPGSDFPFDRPAGRPVATGVRNVSFVEPGTYVEWRDGYARPPVTYWFPAGPSPDDSSRPVDSYVDEYAELLADSVRMQLMSDVPVGVFLSGGLDSALLTAIASQHAPALCAYSLAEPSISASGDTSAAVDLTGRLGIPISLVRVDHAALDSTIGLDLRMFEHFVWLMDFPLFDVEFLFKHELHRHARHANPGLKVVLLGQGADEFAGGYSRLGSQKWEAFAEREAAVWQGITAGRQRIPEPYRRFLNGNETTPGARAQLGSHEPWQFLRFGDLAAYNLWHEDRTAASNGIEARVPFLDHRLVEFLCAVPLERRAELFFDKAIARRAAARFLPPALTSRPKVPLFPRASGAHGSVSHLYRRLTSALFEPFCEEYADDSPFAPDALRNLCAQAMLPSGSDTAFHLLLRCMAIAIFRQQCRGAVDEDFEPPSVAGAPLPLTAPSPPDLGYEKIEGETRLELTEGIHLAETWEDAPALLVIENGLMAARIRIRLTPGQRATSLLTRSFTVCELARALGGTVEETMPLAQTLVRRNWAAIPNEAPRECART